MQANYIKYKKRVIRLSFNIRKGFCSWCSNNIFDGSCKKTNMHHLEYYPIFVWFCTIELCVSCHSFTHPLNYKPVNRDNRDINTSWSKLFIHHQ